MSSSGSRGPPRYNDRSEYTDYGKSRRKNFYLLNNGSGNNLSRRDYKSSGPGSSSLTHSTQKKEIVPSNGATPAVAGSVTSRDNRTYASNSTSAKDYGYYGNYYPKDTSWRKPSASGDSRLSLSTPNGTDKRYDNYLEQAAYNANKIPVGSRGTLSGSTARYSAKERIRSSSLVNSKRINPGDPYYRGYGYGAKDRYKLRYSEYKKSYGGYYGGWKGQEARPKGYQGQEGQEGNEEREEGQEGPEERDLDQEGLDQEEDQDQDQDQEEQDQDDQEEQEGQEDQDDQDDIDDEEEDDIEIDDELQNKLNDDIRQDYEFEQQKFAKPHFDPSKLDELETFDRKLPTYDQNFDLQKFEKIDTPTGTQFGPITHIDSRFKELETEFAKSGNLKYSLATSIASLHDYPFFSRNFQKYLSNKDALISKIRERNAQQLKKKVSLWREYETRLKEYETKSQKMAQQLRILHPADDEIRREIDSGDFKKNAVEPSYSPIQQSPEQFQDEAVGRRGRRHGDLVTTEAEFQEILESLGKETQEDPLLKAERVAAVIPDLILDPIERATLFLDSNNLVTDTLEWALRVRTDFRNNFSESEHELFCAGFCLAPKRFGAISRHMGGLRTARDCVLHYYMTKKDVNYKQILAQYKKKASKKGRRKVLRAHEQKELKHQEFHERQNGDSQDLQTETQEDASASIESSVPLPSPRIEEEVFTDTGRRKRAAAPVFDAKHEESAKKKRKETEKPETVELKLEAKQEAKQGVNEESPAKQESTLAGQESDPAKQDTLAEEVSDLAEQVEFGSVSVVVEKPIAEEIHQNGTTEAKEVKNEQGSIQKDEISKKIVKIAEVDKEIKEVAKEVSEIVKEVKDAAKEVRETSHEPEINKETVIDSNKTEKPQDASEKGEDGQITFDYEVKERRKAISSYWSITEVNLFPELLREYGTKWTTIADKLTTKTATMVRNYFQRNAEKHLWTSIAQDADVRLAAKFAVLQSDVKEEAELPVYGSNFRAPVKLTEANQDLASLYVPIGTFEHQRQNSQDFQPLPQAQVSSELAAKSAPEVLKVIAPEVSPEVSSSTAPVSETIKTVPSLILPTEANTTIDPSKTASIDSKSIAPTLDSITPVKIIEQPSKPIILPPRSSIMSLLNSEGPSDAAVRHNRLHDLLNSPEGTSKSNISSLLSSTPTSE